MNEVNSAPVLAAQTNAVIDELASFERTLGAVDADIPTNTLTYELGESNSAIKEELRIGVGINTGLAALGIGHEATAMGDTVNLAFRLETASKELQKDVVISQSAYNLLPQSLWEDREQEITVKGKKNPVSVIGITFDDLSSFLDTTASISEQCTLPPDTDIETDGGDEEDGDKKDQAEDK